MKNILVQHIPETQHKSCRIDLGPLVFDAVTKISPQRQAVVKVPRSITLEFISEHHDYPFLFLIGVLYIYSPSCFISSNFSCGSFRRRCLQPFHQPTRCTRQVQPLTAHIQACGWPVYGQAGQLSSRTPGPLRQYMSGAC